MELKNFLINSDSFEIGKKAGKQEKRVRKRRNTFKKQYQVMLKLKRSHSFFFFLFFLFLKRESILLNKAVDL